MQRCLLFVMMDRCGTRELRIDRCFGLKNRTYRRKKKSHTNQQKGERDEHITPRELRGQKAFLQFLLLAWSRLFANQSGSVQTSIMNRMLMCEITIWTAAGRHKPIYGLFRSTGEAICQMYAAMNELCCVKVKVL